MPAFHHYGTQHYNLTPDQVARHVQHWIPGLNLVFDMETALKNLNLLPSEESPGNVGLLKLEAQILATVSNVSSPSLYICPVLSGEKLFVRYIETGMCKGFTQKFLPVLCQKHSVSVDSTFLWNMYTDQDIEARRKDSKYKEQQTRGFDKMQY